MELAASLDHVGVLTRSAADAGLLLAAIAGPDRLDPTALQAPRFVTSTTSIDRIDGMRIGVDPRWNESDIDAAGRPWSQRRCRCWSVAAPSS